MRSEPGVCIDNWRVTNNAGSECYADLNDRSVSIEAHDSPRTLPIAYLGIIAGLIAELDEIIELQTNDPFVLRRSKSR